MLRRIKDFFYFPLASYFVFFARIRFKKWNPRVILITGSSGKTTLLHMIESQLGTKAHYSHHANSSYGIPFDILGLRRTTLTPVEWLGLFLSAPFRAFKKPYPEKIYVVEADCDRPYEGRFLGSFLKPEVTLWVSSSRTHSMNFDKLVEEKKFETVEDAIAYEFGNYLEYTKKLAVINGDSTLIEKQLSRTSVKIKEVAIEDLKDYELNRDSTEFRIGRQIYQIKALLPRENFYAIEMTRILCDYLKIKVNPKFPNFHLPAGRSSVFAGIKNITIIDSCYNANLESVKAILNLFDNYSGNVKWAVLGDMLEQGNKEREEHEKIVDEIIKLKLKRVILLGPRLAKYTYPKLHISIGDTPIARFENPREVLNYLLTHIKGGETILFKGARFLEGVIENLLLNESDVKNLSRREKIWEKRRKQWGL